MLRTEKKTRAAATIETETGTAGKIKRAGKTKRAAGSTGAKSTPRSKSKTTIIKRATLKAKAVEILPADIPGFLAGKDRRLARVIEAVGDLRLAQDPMQSPFEALAKAIVYQQLHGKAAATIFQRVLSLYGNNRLDPLLILDTKESDLRAQGLSQNKMLALKDLAQKTASGQVPTLAQMKKMADEEIIETLTSVRGVGQWTVEMLLIFRLGRPDVLPATDYGVRKGLCLTDRMRDLPTPSQVLTRGEKWKPCRSAASWYLWRSLELPEGVI